MSGRMRIVAGIGIIFLLVLAVRQFWPGDGEPPALVPPATDEDDGGGDDGESGGPVASPSGGGGDVSYRHLLAISQSPKPEHMPLVRKALRSPKVEDRHIATTINGKLGEMGDPTLLRKTLKDKAEAPSVRAAAARALGAMRHLDAGPDLIEAMSDPSDLVRTAAGVAISNMMGIKLGFRAQDSAEQRQYWIDMVSERWPRYYPELKKLKERTRTTGN